MHVETHHLDLVCLGELEATPAAVAEIKLLDGADIVGAAAVAHKAAVPYRAEVPCVAARPPVLAISVGDVLQNDPTVRVARGFGNFQIGRAHV